jgi:hypothetical protein
MWDMTEHVYPHTLYFIYACYQKYVALNVHVCPGEQKEFLLQKLETYT